MAQNASSAGESSPNISSENGSSSTQSGASTSLSSFLAKKKQGSTNKLKKNILNKNLTKSGNEADIDVPTEEANENQQDDLNEEVITSTGNNDVGDSNDASNGLEVEVLSQPIIPASGVLSSLEKSLDANGDWVDEEDDDKKKKKGKKFNLSKIKKPTSTSTNASGNDQALIPEESQKDQLQSSSTSNPKTSQWVKPLIQSATATTTAATAVAAPETPKEPEADKPANTDKPAEPEKVEKWRPKFLASKSTETTTSSSIDAKSLENKEAFPSLGEAAKKTAAPVKPAAAPSVASPATATASNQTTTPAATAPPKTEAKPGVWQPKWKQQMT